MWFFRDRERCRSGSSDMWHKSPFCEVCRVASRQRSGESIQRAEFSGTVGRCRYFGVPNPQIPVTGGALDIDRRRPQWTDADFPLDTWTAENLSGITGDCFSMRISSDPLVHRNLNSRSSVRTEQELGRTAHLLLAHDAGHDELGSAREQWHLQQACSHYRQQTINCPWRSCGPQAARHAADSGDRGGAFAPAIAERRCSRSS